VKQEQGQACRKAVENLAPNEKTVLLERPTAAATRRYPIHNFLENFHYIFEMTKIFLTSRWIIMCLVQSRVSYFGRRNVPQAIIKMSLILCIYRGFEGVEALEGSEKVPEKLLALASPRKNDHSCFYCEIILIYNYNYYSHLKL
jgi:hypothetical protein